jgi:hypothetical protein
LVARSRRRDLDDQEGRAGGQEQELGLDPRFWLRDRAGAISMIKKGALVDKSKN